MCFSLIPTVFLSIISITCIACSVVPHAAPFPVATGLRYILVKPQNVLPFAGQVSTFTKGLNIFAAPHAAGIIGGPAIVSRAITGPAFFPGPVHPVVPQANVVAPGLGYHFN